ncbi:MAG: HAD family hydrolase [Peptostreptococcaceae bacterium]
MKNNIENIDSIIFDLDGTLWDSTEGIAKCWSSVLSKYNYSKKEISVDELKGYMGLQLDEIGRRMLPEVEVKLREKLLKECGEFENKYLLKNGAILYDKLEDTLKDLSSRYKLFIVSNCQDGYIETFLEFYGLDKYFKDFECPGRTSLSKAENIKLVIQRNNLKKSIYVGDTHLDGESARKAGVPFVFAKYGFGDTDKFNHYIDKFEDLLKL